MSERTIRPWTTEPCDDCGCDHLATRTSARTLKAGESLLCEGCEMYRRGVREERERCLRICKGARMDAELRDPIEALDYVIHCINGGYK